MSLRQLILPIYLLLILLTSCQKAPVNEDIESFWRLKEYYSIQDNQVYSVQEHYIAITPHLVQLSTTFDTDSTRYIGRMEYINDGLRWHDFYEMLINHDNGVKVEVELLEPWGLRSDDTYFSIEKSNGSELWLRSRDALLKLERY